MKEVKVIKARNDLQTRTRGKTIELMRVGAYCRVSTDSADQLNSYKSQVAYYTDMIKKIKNGYLRTYMLMKQSQVHKWLKEKISSV